jgi:hypothetical protein
MGGRCRRCTRWTRLDAAPAGIGRPGGARRDWSHQWPRWLRWHVADVDHAS